MNNTALGYYMMELQCFHFSYEKDICKFRKTAVFYSGRLKIKPLISLLYNRKTETHKTLKKLRQQEGIGQQIDFKVQYSYLKVNFKVDSTIQI